MFNTGAFAFFGPGQFKNLYPEVTKPIGGRFHFAGEATSIHHAWVVGALNSAMRIVIEIVSLLRPLAAWFSLSSRQLYAIGQAPLVDRLQAQWGELVEVEASLIQAQVVLRQAQFNLGIIDQQ
jgi:hypothetical protein